METALLEPAVSGDDDPRWRANEISRVREAVQSGAGAAVGNHCVIRNVIRRDWDTMLRQGVDPSGTTPQFLDSRELESLRQDRDLALTRRLLVQQLGLVSDSDFMITVCDAHGRVVWTDGNLKIRNEASRFGFIPGALWREMGTNGIRLVTEFLLRGVQVYGPEHWLNPQVRWTCTAAGVYHPRIRPGFPVAVINVMSPWFKVHADTLGWLCLIARYIEEELRTATHESLWRLLVEAAPPLDQIGGPVLVLDSCGVVVAAHEWGLQTGDRVLLPRAGSIAPGRAHLSPLGECVLEPLPGCGWLVRSSGHDEDRTVIKVSLEPVQRRVKVTGPHVSWDSRVRPLHSEIIQCLVGRCGGLTPAELQAELYGAGVKTRVAPEMSKLRKELGWMLQATSRKPGENIYRFGKNVDVDIQQSTRRIADHPA